MCISLKTKYKYIYISKIKNTFNTIFQKVVEFCRNNCCIKNSICPASEFCYIVLIFTELDNLQFISSARLYFVQWIVCCCSQYLTLFLYTIYSKLRNIRFTSRNSPGTISRINSNNSAVGYVKYGEEPFSHPI